MAGNLSSDELKQWQAANRVPLYPEKTNWWLLARTLRDNPSDDDITNTTEAVFVKWFGGWPHEPIEAGGQTTAGPATQIEIKKISRDRLPFPSGLTTSARFEDLKQGPLPLISGAVTYVLVSFAWRSQVTDAPWPVYTSPGVIHMPNAEQQPAGADWMLVAAAKAVETAPEDKSWLERKGKEIVENMPDLPELPSPFKVGLAGLGLGGLIAAIFFWKKRR